MLASPSGRHFDGEGECSIIAALGDGECSIIAPLGDDEAPDPVAAPQAAANIRAANAKNANRRISHLLEIPSPRGLSQSQSDQGALQGGYSAEL